LTCRLEERDAADRDGQLPAAGEGDTFVPVTEAHKEGTARADFDPKRADRSCTLTLPRGSRIFCGRNKLGGGPNASIAGDR
jgi:hypothetical protein